MYKYLREDIKKLQAYEIKKFEDKIRLDANEGIAWLNDLNRYPDDSASLLRKSLAEVLDKDPEELLVGNGSSELIGYIMNAYLEFGETVLSISPTFSMYEIYTIINKGKFEKFPLKNMMDLDVDGFIGLAKKKKVKLIILSNPNNPTGSIIGQEDLKKIISSVDAMVVLDEAYIEFSNLSIEDYTREFENLIVLRTFSKAMGLAGIRLGYMIAHKDTISCVNKIRSPYNVNSFTQLTGVRALENRGEIYKNIELIKSEREKMKKALEERGYSPYPSQANFLFFYGGKDLGKNLAEKGVLIRSFKEELEGYYRISIGTEDENKKFLKLLEGLANEGE